MIKKSDENIVKSRSARKGEKERGRERGREKKVKWQREGEIERGREREVERRAYP